MSTTNTNDLAFKALQALSTVKYAHESTVRNAIHYAAHKQGIALCKQKEKEVYDMVKVGLVRLMSVETQPLFKD